MSGKAIVAIIMGSDSDLPVMKNAVSVLKDLNVPYEVKIMSAHRSPDEVAQFSKQARKRGIKVIIAGAGGAAHLAGVVASHTTLPVIGVPMESKALKGMDSLLSTVQMPGGVPVATVSIGEAGAKNAGVLACQVLGVSSAKMEKRLEGLKKDLVKKVRKKNIGLNV